MLPSTVSIYPWLRLERKRFHAGTSTTHAFLKIKISLGGSVEKTKKLLWCNGWWCKPRPDLVLSVRFQINQSNELTQIVLACDVPQNLRRQHISQLLFHRFLQYYNVASAVVSVRLEPLYTSLGWKPTRVRSVSNFTFTRARAGSIFIFLNRKKSDVRTSPGQMGQCLHDFNLSSPARGADPAWLLSSCKSL